MSLIAQKLISASGATAATEDPDFPLVTSLYHFDGSNGAQNNTFTGVGASGASQAWTRNGSPTQGSFSPFSTEEGKWGVLFEEDNSDFLSLNNSDFSFGTGDYTVECFVLFTGNDSTSGGIFQTANSGTDGSSPAMALRDTTGLTIYTSSGQKITGDNGTFALGVWYHLAFVRASSVVKVYKDGSLVTWNDGTTSVADTTNITNTGFAVGRYYSNSYTLDGYISNFRVVKGTAVYTGAFSKPTTPLTDITNTVLLTCRNNRFMDASSEGNTVSIGAGTPKVQPFSPFAPSAEYDASTMGGSGHFANATSDSISLSDSSLALGNGDFTIEGWFYFDGNYSAGVGLFQQENGLNGPALGWWPGGSNGWQFYYGSGTWNHATGATATMFEWTHIAYVRSSGVVNLYVNGVKATSDISDSTNYASTNFVIGYFYSSTYAMEGYISNFKVSLNAIYTSAFTPPTALVTPTSGGSSAASTKVLVDFTNAGIIDTSRKTNVLTVGNAQLDTSVKKFGSASAEFDGTGDYLTYPLRSFIEFGSSDWTIECFVNVDAISETYKCIYSASYGVQFYVFDDKLHLAVNDTDNISGYMIASFSTAGQIASAGTWYHVAAYRLGSAFYCSVDGAVTAMGTSSATVASPSLAPSIGIWGGQSLPMDGYIDELRITRKARYGSSNFTAPTKAFLNL